MARSDHPESTAQALTHRYASRGPARRIHPSSADILSRAACSESRNHLQKGAQLTDSAVVDLLGALAYGELTAFDRLAEDARMAPTTAGRAALAKMAGAEIGHFGMLCDRLVELGADPDKAMSPFAAPIDRFHDGTRPSTWLESLVKAYVGDGLAADFYREVANFLDESTRALVLAVLADTGHASFAVREVRAAIQADPAIGGRLALWARRLVGEALTQSQRVIAERDGLAELLISGTGDLAGVAELLKRITAAHTVRMSHLGLSS